MNKGNEQVEVVKGGGGLLRRGFSRPPLDVQKKSCTDQNQVDLTQTFCPFHGAHFESGAEQRRVNGVGQRSARGRGGEATYSVSPHIAADVFDSFLLHN